MTTGHVFVATSLDGFIARKDNGLDWLMKHPTADGDGGFGAFMESVDGLVMGAETYRTVLGFGQWPYTRKVVVASRSLTDADVPDILRDRVRISALAPAELMAELGAQGWRRVYVDGGRLVQSFLRAGLIQDLCITQVPVLIGDGLRLFGPLEQDIELKLLGSEVLESGLLQFRYQVG